MKYILARIVAFFQGDIIKKIIKCIPAIVQEAEKAMADGKITAEERKNFAMNAVNIVAEQFGIGISGLTKWVISVIVDSIARKLGSKDVNVPDIIVKVMERF